MPINNEFIVTVKGKRVYMSHDLFSAFSNKTYEDSVNYVIPRNQGVIKGQELPQKKGSYNSVGQIVITGNKMKVDLYYDNYDDKTLDAGTWNGTYELIQRQPQHVSP